MQEIREPRNPRGWKRPLRVWSPTMAPALPRSPLNHVTSLKSFQECWLHRFPGQLVPVLSSTTLSVKIFLNLLLVQFEAISSCPTADKTFFPGQGRSQEFWHVKFPWASSQQRRVQLKQVLTPKAVWKNAYFSKSTWFGVVFEIYELIEDAH